MTQITLREESNHEMSTDNNKNIEILLAVFISIIGLTIFQDFLESNRRGSSFNFSESILFKTIWILFIPLLALLRRVLKNKNLDSLGKTTLFIVTPIIIHLVIIPFVFLFFSIQFYNGRYDIYKILTYTLANDLDKLVIIYSVFVFWHRYVSYRITGIVSSNRRSYARKIIIASGKNNTVVEVNDIFQITAETPYISIQTEEKKYLHTQTLKSIAIQLNDDIFVRIHKSTIVNLDKVLSFKSLLNGDYEILLKNNIKIRLSRTYVSDFKSKFKKSQQVTT